MALFSEHKDESLFTEPLMRYFRHNPLPDLFGKTADLDDDRLLAIVTALIVEDRIDAFLGSFLPRYARLSSKDFTFSMKIALAETFAFIPPRLLSAATIFRKIRNEFAHNLELDSFSTLKQSLISDLINLRREVFGIFGEDERKPKATFLDEYKSLAFYCVAGLDAYRENLSYLRAFIERPEFIDGLFRTCAAENEAEMKAVLSKPPISVEIQDGHRIERYEKGVVNIIAAEGGGNIDLGKILTPKPADN
jgi:hypothetical protein